MKRFTAIVAISFSAVLAALGAATPAGAGGQAGLGCSPGFDVGAVTWEQYVNLPRNEAGLAAGKYTEDDLKSEKFDPTDFNGDGMICVKDVALQVGSGATPVWQYFYDIADDNASASDG